MSPLVTVKMPSDRQIKDPSGLHRMSRLPVRPHVYACVNGVVQRVDLNREVTLDAATISALVDAGATITYVETEE